MTIVIFEETDDVYEAKDFIKVMNFIFFFGRLLFKCFNNQYLRYRKEGLDSAAVPCLAVRRFRPKGVHTGFLRHSPK